MHYLFKRVITPLLFIFFLSTLQFSKAQSPDMTPQSPNAAALGKYGDIPVSYTTGIPSVSIPLCAIKGKNLSLPISLNYHSGGIKVDELSSNIGLGWSLSAGGVITRTVVGKPDEKTNGYATYAFDANNSDHLTKAAEGKWDTEPDMFYFNVTGFSGKFFVDAKDADGNYVIKLIPYQDIKIIWKGTNEWTLIDPSGTEYLFNVPEETSTEVQCENTESITPPVVTSWYLQKIKHLNGDEITFTYGSEPYTYRQGLNESRYVGDETSSCKLPNNGVISQCYTFITVDGVRVTEIKSAFEKVIFNYTTVRQDIEGQGSKALSSCELQVLTPNNTYKRVKKFNLAQSYFVSTLPTSIVEEGKRLKLVSVQEVGFDATNAEISLPSHTFTYLEADNYNLPPRLSFKQDHWGFANDNTITTLIPKDITVLALINGANRNSHVEKVKSGIIRSITYPTGGYTEFDFEANSANSTNNAPFYDEEVVHSAHAAVRNFTGQSGFKSDKSDFTISRIDPTSTAKISVTVSWATYNTRFTGDGEYDVAIYRKNDYTVPVWQGGGTTRGQSSLILLDAGDYEVYAEVNLQNEVASVSVTWKTYERLSVQNGQDAGNATVGGVRVKQIKSYASATAQPIIKRFDYIAEGESSKTSGVLASIPKYIFPYNSYVQIWGESSGATSLTRSFAISLSIQNGKANYFLSSTTLPQSIITSNVPPTGVLLSEYTCGFKGYNSSSKVPLGTTQGSPVYYSKVTIYSDANGDNGKSELFYTEKKDALNYVYPYVQHDSYDWQRGLLEKQIDYKKTPTGYVEIKRVVNTYKFDRLNANDNSLSAVHNYTKKGYSVVFYPANPTSRLTNALYQVKINSHRIMSPWYSLLQTKIIQDGVESIINYTYDETNGLHTQAVETITKGSNDAEQKTAMTYEWLPNRYILVLTESRAYGNGKLIGGIKNEYKNFTFGTKILPLQWRWSNILKDNTILIKGVIPDDGYTSDGLLTKIRQTGYSIDQVYQWTNGLLTQKSFGGLNQYYSYYETEFPFSRQLKSVTDENGFTSKFYYDPLQRLEKAESYFADNTLRSTTTQTYTFGNGSASSPNKINSTTIFKDIPDPLSTTQYFDGLGRPIEVVKEKYTPKVEPHLTEAWHQKSYITYDALGRQDRSYQPFESAEIGLETTVPSGTLFVYAQYEASPLSRPLKQYAEDGKYVQMDYGANTSNEVRKFTVGTTTDEGSSVTPNGFYEPNTLYKTTITNENGTTTPNGNRNKTDVFKDKLGRVILTRKYLDNTEGGKIDTYNVYDDYGNLVMVIPPGAIDASSNITPDLVFTYKYNNKNLLCEKKIPGSDCQKFFYNNRDALTFTQDGNMRAANANKYLATEYDQYGRLTRTAWVETTNPTTDALLADFSTIRKDWITNHYYETQINPATNSMYNRPTGIQTRTLGAKTGEKAIIGQSMYYNAKGEMYYTGKDNLEGINWDYFEFNAAGKSKRHEVYHWGRKGGQYSTTYQSTYDHALRNTDNTLWFWGASVAATLPTMHLSELVYNYKDQLVEKSMGRIAWAGGKGLQSVDYTYNQRGWLTDINQQPLSYHNQIVTTVQVGRKQFQQYSVDPNPTFRIMPDEGSVDLFSESIRYDNPDVNLSSLATPQYNGNISQAVWQVAGREQQAYTYKYDALDRLLEGEYTDIHDMDGLNAGSPYSTDNKFGEKLTYDLRGNIVSLKRNGMIAPGLAGGSVVSGTFGQIDDLKYTYNTQNQVTAITDFSNAAKGFKGGSSAYTYDANGNLKSDVAKGITNIVYNYLNLPQVIQFTGGRSIEFVYDATGAKLRKTVIAPNVPNIVTDYMNGFEYKDGLLEKIYHTEGYVERQANGTFQYNYTLKDHLGNTRVTFADKDNSGTIDPNTEINQINHYAPFGLNLEGNWNGASPDAKNKYQFGDKEFQSDFGLNWSDHGARMYDAAIGRWNGIDPKAGKLAPYSPYTFCLNRPTILVDPDGQYPILTITNEQTGYTISRVPGVGGAYKAIPTYKATLSDITTDKDGKTTTKELGTYHITRDGWYSLGYGKDGKPVWENRGFQPRNAGVTTYKAVLFPYETAAGTYALALRQNEEKLKNHDSSLEATPLTTHKDVNGAALDKKVDRKIDNIATGIMVHIFGAFTHLDGKVTIVGTYGCLGVVTAANVFCVKDKDGNIDEKASISAAQASYFTTFLNNPSNETMQDLGNKINNASEPKKLEVVIPQQK